MPAFEAFTAPLTVGLVSDTHLRNARKQQLPQRLLDGLAGCDLILHGGDVTERWVLETLAAIAPVRAVAGNGDASLPDLPLERFFTFGAFTVGLVHGHEGPGTARDNAYARMHGVVDCVVYGHSHRPEIVTRGGLLMINPGSPTRRRWEPRHSYAMLRVTDRLVPELIDWDDEIGL